MTGVGTHASTLAELANLYHLARVSVGDDRHARMVQATKWYQAEHPDVGHKRVWLLMCEALEHREL